MHDETQSVPGSVAVSTIAQEENSSTPTLSVVTSEADLEINTDSDIIEMPVPFSEIPTNNAGTFVRVLENRTRDQGVINRVTYKEAGWPGIPGIEGKEDKMYYFFKIYRVSLISRQSGRSAFISTKIVDAVAITLSFIKFYKKKSRRSNPGTEQAN